MDFASVTIIGNLARDMSLHISSSGLKTCSNSVAVNRNEVTDWYNVTWFGKSAEMAVEYCYLGAKVFIIGDLKLKQYLGKDSTDKQSLDVNVQAWRVLSYKGDTVTEHKQDDDSDHSLPF